MEMLLDGLLAALELIRARDPLVLGAALRSVWISTAAVGLAALVGVPLAVILARRETRVSRLTVVAARAGMALPTVFIGLVCYALFSRRGPLGALDLLYTPWGIVCGELMLALPIVVSVSHGAVRALDPRVATTVRTLGASWWRRGLAYVGEARTGVVLAVLTAFARCVTELGIAMMVGGNIKERTRTLATATALETGKGEFERGMAMGLLLVGIALGVTLIVGTLARERSR